MIWALLQLEGYVNETYEELANSSGLRQTILFMPR